MPAPLVQYTNINNNSKRCQPIQKTRRKYHKKIFDWTKESKWETYCKYTRIKYP